MLAGVGVGRREQASLPPHTSLSHTLTLTHFRTLSLTDMLLHTHSLSLAHTASLALSVSHTHTGKALDLVFTIVFIHRAFSGTGRAPKWLLQSGHQADKSGCRSGCQIA